MKDLQNLKGKKIKDLITDKTKICGIDIEEDFDIGSGTHYYNEYINEEITERDLSYNKNGKYYLMGDEEYFSLFEDGELTAIINVYEGCNPHINEKRKTLIIAGHESVGILYLDNYEYEEFYTR